MHKVIKEGIKKAAEAGEISIEIFHEPIDSLDDEIIVKAYLVINGDSLFQEKYIIPAFELCKLNIARPVNYTERESAFVEELRELMNKHGFGPTPMMAQC